MTSRERLLTTLAGGFPDRVPVAPFVQEEYLCWVYPGRASVDRVVDAVELARGLGFDLMAKHRGLEQPHFLRRACRGWEFRRETSSGDGIVEARTEIATPRGTLTEVQAVPEAGRATVGLAWTTRKHLLETREEAEIFAEFLPPLDDAMIGEMRGRAAEWGAVLGESGVAAPWGWAGVFNFAARLLGIEALMMAPHDDPAGYEHLMGRLAEAMSAYNVALVEAGIPCVGIQGHMANANTVSPAFFRRWVQPYEKRVIDAIHGAGGFTVYHNCGLARSLYANYAEMGMTLWETVSEPPRGDNSLGEAKRVLGDRICLLGNLDQVDFLKRAAPGEVAEATRRTVEIGKPGGRYIFSTSDFLERDTPWENVVAMIEAAKEAGGY